MAVGTTPFIQAKGHVWLIDCDVQCSNYNTAIKAPYVLLDNVDSNISVNTKAMDTPHRLSIEHCNDVTSTDTEFKSSAIVVDLELDPAEFTYALINNTEGKLHQIASRRKLHPFWPAYKANPYDDFKNSTQYTNVDLHRYIDQDSPIRKGRMSNYISSYIVDLICQGLYESSTFELEAIPDEVIHAICRDEYEYDGHPHWWPTISIEVIESIIHGTWVPEPTNGYELDETASRKYDVGIYSLNSYRTTELPFYDDNSLLELP